MKKLVSHGVRLDYLDLSSLMKEARDAHLLTVNIKTYVDDDIAQATSTAAKVESFSATLTKLLTPVSGGLLDSMHHALKIVDRNIGMLQKTLTGLCKVFGNLEQKIHYLSQHEKSQSIKDSLTISPINYFDVRLYTLAVELYVLWQLTEVGGFNTVVGNLKSLNDVTVWVQANPPSDAPKFEHFIDLDILLAGIEHTGVTLRE